MTNTAQEQEQESFSAFESDLWTIKERDYVELVDEAMRKRKVASFRNDSLLHAAHIIRGFFLGAKKEMRIFSGKLRRYGDHYLMGSEKVRMKAYADERILSAMSVFLADKKTKLKIVVEEKELDEGTDSHPLVMKLNALQAANKLKGSCKIALLPEAEKGAGRCHMMVMDRSAYRLETDRDKAKALVGCGDAFVAGRLIDVFDNSLWDEDRLLWPNAPAAK